METIAIGRITAPVGIKGEMRVFSYADELTRFSDVKSVLVDGRSYDLESVRYQKGMAVIRLAGIGDRNAAESFRGKELRLSRDELWETPEDTFFIEDFVGLRDEDEEGRHVGRLAEVISRPAQDLYRIEKSDGGSFLLPAVREFVREIDLESGFMKIRLIEGLSEL